MTAKGLTEGLGFILYCSHCGSRDVQISAWIRPNHNDEIMGSGEDGPSSHEWCDECAERGDEGDTRTTTDRREAAAARLARRREREEMAGALAVREYGPEYRAVPLCLECDKRPRAGNAGGLRLTCAFRAMRLLILLRTFTHPKGGTK